MASANLSTKRPHTRGSLTERGDSSLVRLSRVWVTKPVCVPGNPCARAREREREGQETHIYIHVPRGKPPSPPAALPQPPPIRPLSS
eukprot:1562192-Rhodomonas_salina.2